MIKRECNTSTTPCGISEIRCQLTRVSGRSVKKFVNKETIPEMSGSQKITVNVSGQGRGGWHVNSGVGKQVEWT